MVKSIKAGSAREGQQRQHIAVEAARIMAEQGVRDFAQAKKKAALRLGLSKRHKLPNNQEVEKALAEYQRLFHADTQPQRLRQLRETALQAMRMLSVFQPRLVGQVLHGTAGEYSPVNLHLFADAPEEIDLFLHDRNIPFEVSERTARYGADRTDRRPLYRFQAGTVDIELTVFPVKGLRQAPLGPIDARPMQRADTAAVERLLEDEDWNAQSGG